MAELLHTRLSPCRQYVDRFYSEDGKIWRVRTQHARDEHLAQLEVVRRNPDNLKATDGLRWALSIPEDDYAVLVRDNPDLVEGDGESQHKAWQKFMKTEEARKYMVRVPSRRGMTL